MKKIAIGTVHALLAALICSACLLPAAAVKELEINAPTKVYYRIYEDELGERITVSSVLTEKLSLLTALDEETLKESYGVSMLLPYVQVDAKIDGGEWLSLDGWDETPDVAGFSSAFSAGDAFRNVDIFMLSLETGRKAAGKLSVKKDGKYVFDLEKHTLEIRSRVIAYAGASDAVVFSPWTEPVKVTRGNKLPEFGKKLPKPDVSDVKVDYVSTSEMPFLSFKVRADESFREAAALLSINEKKYVTLECEASYGDGVYEPVNLASDSSAVALDDKIIYFNDYQLEDAFLMSVRVRYVVYLDSSETITSEWSEVRHADIPRWKEGKGIMHAKCKVCGVCYPILGLCDFVWLAILLAIAGVAAVAVKTVKKNKAMKDDAPSS